MNLVKAEDLVNYITSLVKAILTTLIKRGWNVSFVRRRRRRRSMYECVDLRPPERLAALMQCLSVCMLIMQSPDAHCFHSPAAHIT